MKKLNDLVARLPDLQEQSRQREAKAQKQREATDQDDGSSSSAAVLPSWSDNFRAVPNGFLRSALFGAVAKGRRRYMAGEQLAALDGIEMRYTGQQLDQCDLDVWESILHVVRALEMGSQCRVTSYAMLKLMGLTDTGKNRANLHDRITRLRAGTIELKQGRHVYIGGLIGEAFKDEETQEWVIALNPKLRALYGSDQFTHVDWAVRRALNGKPLAQWLHGFYASHAKPFPMKVETLLRLCGSESELRRYRQTLGEALDAVAEASAAHGEVFSYEIRGDLVHIEKRASGPQRRHLAKKASKPRKPRA